MEGFTPTFFLEVIVAMGSAFAAYGAVRSDLKHMRRDMDEERRLRERHEKEDDVTHHDIRNEMQVISNRLSKVEGMR